MPMTTKQAIRILTIDTVMKEIYKRGGSIGFITWEEVEQAAQILYSHRKAEFDNRAEQYAKTWNSLDEKEQAPSNVIQFSPH